MINFRFWYAYVLFLALCQIFIYYERSKKFLSSPTSPLLSTSYNSTRLSLFPIKTNDKLRKINWHFLRSAFCYLFPSITFHQISLRFALQPKRCSLRSLSFFYILNIYKCIKNFNKYFKESAEAKGTQRKLRKYLMLAHS